MIINIGMCFIVYLKKKLPHKMDVSLIVDYSCASLGIVPIFCAIYKELPIIVISSILGTISALGYTAVHGDENNIRVRNVFSAMDAICGVLITLTCAFKTNLHTTYIGVFRILWLVTLVTSSTSYAFFSELLQQEQIPNDITIIALLVSIILLGFSAIYIKCKGRDIEPRSNWFILTECILIVGALILRFQTDIERFIYYNIGYNSWHLSCWIALLICCKQIEEENQ